MSFKNKPLLYFISFAVATLIIILSIYSIKIKILKNIQPQRPLINEEMKKYSSTLYNYSLIYPNNYYIQNDYGINNKFIITPYKPDDQLRNTEANIVNSLKIAIIDNKKFENLVAEFQQNSNEGVYVNFSIKNITINNNEAAEIQYSDPYSGNILSVVLINNNNITVEFDYFKDTVNKEAYDNIVKSVTFSN